MSRSRKSDDWTPNLEKALIAFMRDRPIMWDNHHTDFHSVEGKRKAFMECAAMLGHPITWERVRDRWTNMRTTFTSNYRRTLYRTGSETESPKPSWNYYNDLLFLEPIVAARWTAKSQSTLELPMDGAAVECKMEGEDPLYSPPQYYEYESNTSMVEDEPRPSASQYPDSVGVAHKQETFAAREEDEWDDFGKMVAKIMRKMAEDEARVVQLEFFKILTSRSKSKS